MRKIMAALDIGNSLIKLVVAESTRNGFNILSVSQTETKGIKKNDIINENELSESILTVLKDGESKLNIPIKKLITIVPSFDIEFTIGEAKIKNENEDKKITGDIISKVLEESAYKIIPPNMELVNIIPMHFKLDNNQIVSDPRGIASNTISVKSVVLLEPKKSIHKILNILNKLNIEVLDISIGAMGDYYTFRDEKTDRQIGVLINIGANNTTVSIFNKGVITNVSTIELGGRNIDNDISYIYKVTNSKAKELKEEYAYATPKHSLKNDDLVVKDKDNRDVTINQEEISKIVNSRLKEIMEKVKIEIKHLTKKKISYIIVTGGVTEMIDFKEIVEEEFTNLVVYSDIKDLGARNNKFSSVIGLIKWYNDIQKLKERDYSIFSIDEQEQFSGMNKQDLDTNNSVLGKFFSYFFDN